MKTLHIKDIEKEPIERISFLTIPQNSIEPSEYSLPIYKGKIEGLPENINAIVVTSDLQGVVIQNDENVLLGEILAENLKLIFDIYFPEIDRKETIVFLCGDLYTDLIKRGQSGNPTKVWEKFASVFGQTIGIGGNHDKFDNVEDINKIQNAKLLINEIFEIEGLRIKDWRIERNYRTS